jgi:hypothetical protein
MGDSLRLANGERADFTIQVLNGAGGMLEVISDGKLVTPIADAHLSQANETKHFQITGDGQRHWYRINLRSANAELVALTNPIYINFAGR